MKRANYIHSCFAVLIGIIWLVPVFYLINVAFKPASELYTSGVFTVVQDPSFANFIEAWGKIKGYLINSAVYVVTSVPLGIFLASLAAYGVSRIRSPKAAGLAVTFFTIGMLIPVHITLLPNYLTMMQLKLLDTVAGMVILYTVFNIPFAFYLMYGAMVGVSRDIADAAAIDGASPWRTFWNIYLPICKPSIVISALLNFIAVWNELIFANTFIQSNTKYPITTGLLQFVGEFTTAYEKITAGILMSALPIIIIFLFFRKSIMTGMTEGAVKG